MVPNKDLREFSLLGQWVEADPIENSVFHIGMTTC